MASSYLGTEWHISEDGLNILTENGTVKDSSKVYKTALDSDLKLIGQPFLSKEITKQITGKIVLQIQKIKNVAAPKAKQDSQAASRMLKLTLTDGDTNIQGIELTRISSLSRDKTAPGTKIIINNAKIYQGFLLLGPENCQVLGGQVAHLHDKWLLAKSVQSSRQKSNGAPPWVNFGGKIEAVQETNFKSLDNQTKQAKEEGEFEQLRKEAIAVASSGAVKKTFGGRVKQTVQPVVSNHYKRNNVNKEDRGKHGKHNFRQKDEDEIPQKPPQNVSLFSFLEDKLPVEECEKSVPQISNTTFSQNRNDSYYQPKNTNNRDKYEAHNYHKSSQNNYQNNRKYEQNYPKQDYQTQRQGGRQYNKPSNTAKPDVTQKSWHNFESTPRAPSDKNIPDRRHNNSRTNQSEPTPKPTENKSESQTSKPVNSLTNNFSKLSVNNDFASRSLRQHLNLGPSKKREDSSNAADSSKSLNIGQECMAKYWEDGKFYLAVITAATDKTYAVKFKGYGNTEEIYKSDCFIAPSSQHYNSNSQQSRPYSGTMEFRNTKK